MKIMHDTDYKLRRDRELLLCTFIVRTLHRIYAQYEVP